VVDVPDLEDGQQLDVLGEGLHLQGLPLLEGDCET
jgi:hypothetical protein